MEDRDFAFALTDPAFSPPVSRIRSVLRATDRVHLTRDRINTQVPR
jgi:hypothetical protein